MTVSKIAASKLTPERQEILDLLREHAPDQGMRLKEISEMLGKSVANISKMLTKMQAEGLTFQPKYGSWDAVTQIKIERPQERDGVSTISNYSNAGCPKIYFIKNNAFIKIGISKNLKSRISSFKTSNPNSIELLYCYEGGYEEEKRLHSKFKKYNYRNEWFFAHQEIFDYIENKKTEEL